MNYIISLLTSIVDFLEKYNGAVTAVATAFIAIFTVVLARVTGKQARLSRESIDLARQEFVSTHRPRIILREAIIGSVLEGEPLSVNFHLANIGETAGRIVRSSMRVEIVARGFERLMLHGSVEAQNDLGEIPLNAGAAILLKFQGETPKWNAEQFRLRALDTTSGPTTYRNANVHFVGQLIYVDQLGTPRRTAFRRELNPERQRFYRIPDEPDFDYSD